MLKSLPVALGALFIVVGCVSVAPNASQTPSSATSGAPSLGVTTPAPTAAASATPAATATVASTATPTASPTTEVTFGPPPSGPPTLEPSDEPSLEPSVEPSVGPSGQPGTRDVIYDDDMSDPTSGWSTLDQDYASIGYDSGALAFRFNTNQAWAFSTRKTDAHATLFPVADFAPQSDGIFGLLCGNSIGGQLYGAVVGTDGSLVFLQIQDTTVTVLKRHDDLNLDVSVGESNPMALECAVDGAGGLSMVVGLSGTGPVAAYRTNADAPLFLDLTGMYAEATSVGYTLTVDSAAGFGIAGSGGTMSDGATILLAHIPTDYQQNCYESPQFSDNAEFKVTCLPESGDGPEIERYGQYTDKTTMDTDYQDLVDAFGVDSTGSCMTGPNETTWSVNGQSTVGGRVECAPQKVGIRFDWSDDLTNIMSTLIDFDGSYPKTYDSWTNAGPIIPQG